MQDRLFRVALKTAQVGVGNFGAYRRARLRETGLFELVAAYDHNPQFLADAEREDGARPCASYDELLDTPGLEAVVISTGAKFHAEQALAAMQRGLHVFIEKPLCSTPQEMHALVQAQQQYSVVAGCGHKDHAHDAVALAIKQKIEGGELGAVAAFEKTTAHNGGFHIQPGDWRGDRDKNPGGMLFQCGVHALHELMFYFGPVKSVQAKMRTDVHTTQTADCALCILEFDSGLVGTLNAYHVTPYRHTLSVFGTKANLYRDERYGDEGTRLMLQRSFLDGAYEPHESVPFGGESDDCGNLRSWFNAIRSGSTPYPSLVDGARAVAVVFAAEEAANSGNAVPLARLEK